MEGAQVAKILKQAPLFADLDDGALAKVAAEASVRTFRKGALIFYQGDPGDSLYVLAEGVVKVFVTSAHGDEMVLATLRPPDALGEVALLDLGERSASAEAIEPVVAIAFARSTLIELMREIPAIGDAVLRKAGALLRRLTGQAADLVFLDLEGRVAKLLVQMAERQMAERQGTESDDAIVLDVGVTQSDLARMVGGSRQSVNSILHNLDGRGFLEVHGREVRIVDLEALRRRASMP
jgi:CRP-like cAMP-binding protein